MPDRIAKAGDIVRVHFVGKTADGAVFESTRDGKARPLRIGAKAILPAFEEALVGMRAGERKTFAVKAAQAFGPHVNDETMIQVIYKSNQPHAIDYKIGRRLVANIEYPDGRRVKREVTIIAQDEKTFTVDANHPLAGKDLVFEVELVGFGES